MTGANHATIDCNNTETNDSYTVAMTLSNIDGGSEICTKSTSHFPHIELGQKAIVLNLSNIGLAKRVLHYHRLFGQNSSDSCSYSLFLLSDSLFSILTLLTKVD